MGAAAFLYNFIDSYEERARDRYALKMPRSGHFFHEVHDLLNDERTDHTLCTMIPH